VVRDLLFADDRALVAHTPADAQLLFDRFFNADKRFGLTVSLKKTEAISQSYPPIQTASVRISAGDDNVLKSVDKFATLAVSCPIHPSSVFNSGKHGPYKVSKKQTDRRHTDRDHTTQRRIVHGSVKLRVLSQILSQCVSDIAHCILSGHGSLYIWQTPEEVVGRA